MTEQVQLSFSSEVDPDIPWAVTGAWLSEYFNRPYRLELAISSDDPLAEPVNLLGTSVTVTFERGEFHREVHGIVAGVVDGQRGEEETIPATLTVVPALEVLRHRRNSRIFSDQSIKDTLVEVLEAGLGGYERSVNVDFLSGEYPVQEYTTQYQETDLDFVHRLMEEYGIGYRFDSADGVEELVLFDDDGANFALTSLNNEDGMLPLSLLEGGAEDQEDCRQFARKLELRPSVARSTLFDWSDPGGVTDFEDSASVDFGEVPNGASIGPEREDYNHSEPSSLFGYRSEGLDADAVDLQVAHRRALHQRDAQIFAGRGTATQMQPGSFFELLNHPQGNLDAEYLVTKVVHEAGDMVGGDDGEHYHNSFECLPIAVEWRPDRATPRPRIPGIQTATVVGPEGEEIFTDEHGRIKVQFDWDRRKHNNDEASCFIRVVQPWAGNGWGFVFLPRIGMEVAVTFIDGDPDRPVITGSLYNGDNATPYTLPDDKTKSTIKTQSSPGGGGFNELRFEDAAGSEEIYVHAQKDYNERVLNNHSTDVGNDQSNDVGRDQTQTVGRDQTETVTQHQKMTVNGNRTVKVVGAFDETIDGGETRKITCGVDETIAGGEVRKVSDSVDETITGGETRKVTGTMDETVNGNTVYHHNGNLTDTITGSYSLTATTGFTIMAPGGINVTAPGGINIIDPTATTETSNTKWSSYAATGEAVGFKFSLVGGKVDIVPALALALVGIKIDLVGLKVDICKVKYANKPMSVEDALVAIISKVIDLNFDDLEITF